jgi:hypothetical protein
LTLMFGKTTMLATLDNQAFLKNVGVIKMVPANPAAAGAPRGGARGGRGGAPNAPAPAATPTVEIQPTLQGTWKEDGANYKFNFSAGLNYEGSVDGDTLMLTGSQLPLTFDREY